MASAHAADTRRAVALVALGLAAVVVALRGCQALHQERGGAEGQAEADAALVSVERFAARLEKSAESERLAVSLSLRARSKTPMACYVFIVARTERARPRAWAIWPAQRPGLAISAGGHFHAADPTTGHAVQLDEAWTRVDATLPRAVGQPPFESVVVYLVSPEGKVLMARPFSL